MSATASDIVKAAVDAAAEALRQHGLEHEIRHLSSLFAAAAEEKQSTVRAVLVTPTGDAGDVKKTIADALEKSLGRPVDLQERADASMIGGVILQFGDERIDMSVRGALERMATDMSTTGTTPVSGKK